MRICVPPRAGGFRHFAGRLLNGQFIDFLVTRRSSLCALDASALVEPQTWLRRKTTSKPSTSQIVFVKPQCLEKGHLLQMRESPAFHQTVVPVVLIVPLPLDHRIPILSWRRQRDSGNQRSQQELSRELGFGCRRGRWSTVEDRVFRGKKCALHQWHSLVFVDVRNISDLDVFCRCGELE